MTQYDLSLSFTLNWELINENIEALKEKLDYLPADEITIWNAIHSHLKWNTEYLTDEEYDQITLKLDEHIKKEIL